MRFQLFTWFFFSIFLGISPFSASSKCLNNQVSLLLQLKRSLRFNSSVSTKLVTWNPSSKLSNWVGIDWDNAGCVIGLDLSSESITSGIENSTLFSIEHLQRLNLASNSFSHIDIPTAFEKLTNLNFLNLSNAGFAGQVPLQIAQMTSLVTLDLSSFYFQGIPSLKLENPNLKRLVQNLTKLKELLLDGVNVSSPGAEWCGAVSSSLPKLQVLSLSNCYLSGPFDSSLLKLASLSVIRLSQNNISSPVPEFFANFHNLTTLRLSSCGLWGTFPSKIFQVPTLETLDLEDNEQLQGSLPTFQQNGSLQSLVLSTTSFSGSLPDSIGELKQLSKIDLKHCNFNGTIPRSMISLSELVYLDFSFNRFTGAIPMLQMSNNLTYIDLSSNILTGPITSIPWEVFQNLKNINLQSNQLNGSIPSSLLTLPSLQKIQLSNNQFTGHLRTLPNPTSSVLDTLDLSYNKLNGPIPESAFKLKKLNSLSLSHNNFSGTIDLTEIHGLANLNSLSLSYNSLSLNVGKVNSSSSSFPQITMLRLAACGLRAFPDLRNQPRLVYLDLSNNQISGEIPDWIWGVGEGTLQHLNLSHNFLEGLHKPYTIPSFLSVLDLQDNLISGRIPEPPPSATYVDYSCNLFNSSLPSNISSSLAFAVFFSLSNNTLHGPIPESICNAPFLEVLDLSNNSLNGTIPSCLIQGSGTLGVLNLQGNQFQQISQDTVQGSCGLKTLDLNNNLLHGKVSKSLAKCKTLEVLNLGNNKIMDTFPCWLKNVSTLRVLVLRSNKFYGNISCSGGNYSWPNLQIIDLASNEFGGILSSTCFSSWKAMTSGREEMVSNSSHLRFEVLQLSKVYYQDTVTLSNKGLSMELVKILTLFTSIDLSNNEFAGSIPEAVGQLTSLYVLNLSSNHLTGTIPSSLGNLKQLGSLDLSSNQLTGEIPPQLSSLSFLSFLNMSSNNLTGAIPKGSQFQTFSDSSFKRNEGLCGSPLKKSCKDPKVHPFQTTKGWRSEFDWQFIYSGVGVGVGAGLVLVPLLFWEKGRKWFNRSTKQCLVMAFPSIRPFYMSYENTKVAPVECSSAELTGVTGDFGNDYNKDWTEDGMYSGRFCLFCSKLDINGKNVTHNKECKCHESLAIFLSSASSSL